MNNQTGNKLENNFEKIKKCFVWMNKPFAKHCLLAGTLLITAIICTNFFYWEGERIARSWYSSTKHFKGNTKNKIIYEIEYQDKSESKSIINSKQTRKIYLDGFKNSTLAEKRRITQQLKIIELNATNHAQIVIFFYTRLFSELILASGTAIIAAVCLFYISKSGWEKANNYIINVFVVTTGVTVFIGALPIVFQQEQNIQSNKKLYIDYVNLENEILTKLATQKSQKEESLESIKSSQSIVRTEAIELSQIILETEKKLKELNQISIGFDSTGVPNNSDVFGSLSKINTGTD